MEEELRRRSAVPPQLILAGSHNAMFEDQAQFPNRLGLHVLAP